MGTILINIIGSRFATYHNEDNPELTCQPVAAAARRARGERKTMSNGSRETATTRARARLASIDYDFGHFTLDGFARWLGNRRGRQIVFLPRHMPGTLFGAWLAGSDTDYVFYEANTHPLHQAHIRLHEMAHMLCDHPTLRVDASQTQAFLQQSDVDFTSVDSLILRSTLDDEREQEAELLTTLIHNRVLHYAQSRSRTSATALDRNLASFIEMLEVD
jgi:hypothetical protein